VTVKFIKSVGFINGTSLKNLHSMKQLKMKHGAKHARHPSEQLSIYTAKRTIVLLLVLIACSQASAVTFKCDRNGSINYQDKPCNDDVTVLQRPDSKKETTQKKTPGMDKTRQLLHTLETARKQRELKYKITLLQRDIEDLQAQRDQQVQVLQTDIEKMDDFEDVIEEEEMTARINQEIDAIKSQYAALIEDLSKKIQALQKKLEQSKQ